ncbi:NADH dehydrogenase, fad-containing subunit [Halogeometricum pallidum JCM 14848]|uniref:NADH dehydrogenase, fad-containing subunit n=1 Tax=Halogeometricum pallidum JCM 14848 TaxID=1227487 RepID=M0CXA8_HALPD|nr:FAD-dependent oxidoreductase [Halogeometricum pallidum]ELZ26494.1 NADH dehydrogenase, fad-containing subunit [Halogeometricum pallidum JCM 14848]
MRVLVLGAGYAGVTLARRLESRLPDGAELVVVDEDASHLVLHEVHRVIRRPGLAETIQVPLEDLFDRAEVRLARVDGVDRDARRVSFADGTTLDYDYAAICLGSATAYYGLPGVEEHSLPLKSVADAEAIRESFLGAVGAAGRSEAGDSTDDGSITIDVSDEGAMEAEAGDDDPSAAPAGDGTVSAVVGGAGLSGVQTAGELAALAEEEGVEADVTLVEQLDHVAPNFPKNFREAVREALETRGIDVRTGTSVERVTEEAVETDAGTFAYDTFVWTGGIAGQAAMGGDRPVVRSDLRLDERTFAVGDAARVVDADGEAVPASASAALREARTVADNLAELVRHETEGETTDFAPRMEPYRFEVPGWIVSVGDGAVAQLGPTVVTGSAAKAMKASVGAGHLSSVGAVKNAVDLVEEELS